MMNKKTLSADTLFHFTSSRKQLIGILSKGFYPMYCIEDWSVLSGEAGNREDELAIPMVCFCDIQLSQIHNHISVYGSYAIGLTKEWGIKNKITPLLYVHENSFTSSHLKEMRKSYFNKTVDEAHDDGVFYQLVDLMKFCKPYEGRLFKKDYTQDNIRFYDEREWRYCPTEQIRQSRNNGDETTRPSFSKWEFRHDETADMTKLEEANNTLKKFALSFMPSDVKYIVVAEEKERSGMVDEILNMPEEKLSPNSNRILASKIMSAEQIINDF